MDRPVVPCGVPYFNWMTNCIDSYGMVMSKHGYFEVYPAVP